MGCALACDMTNSLQDYEDAGTALADAHGDHGKAIQAIDAIKDARPDKRSRESKRLVRVRGLLRDMAFMAGRGYL